MGGDVAGQGGALSVPGFTLSRVGLIPEGEPTFDQYRQLFAQLRHMEGAIHWLIGDGLVQVERKWGGRYEEAVTETGFEYQTCRVAKYVAGRIDLLRRLNKLSFEHHRAVAKFEPDEQDELLSTAEACKWSVKDLRAHIRERKGKDDPAKEFYFPHEAEEIFSWLTKRRETWPSEWRPGFVDLVRRQLDRLEAADECGGVEGGEDSVAEIGDDDGGGTEVA